MSILRSFFLAGYTASMPALVGRSQVGAGELVLRGDLLDGLHHRPGHRGRPGGDDRARARRWPSTRCRSSLSALGLAFVRRDLRAPVDRPRQRLVTEIREGIDYIVGQPDAAQRDPVLGRDLDPARAARDGADGPRHARPRLTAVRPRADPRGVRRRDGGRLAGQRAPDRPRPRRARSWSAGTWSMGLRCSSSLSVASRSRSCSPSASWPASPSRWSWSCTSRCGRPTRPTRCSVGSAARRGRSRSASSRSACSSAARSSTRRAARRRSRVIGVGGDRWSASPSCRCRRSAVRRSRRAEAGQAARASRPRRGPAPARRGPSTSRRRSASPPCVRVDGRRAGAPGAIDDQHRHGPVLRSVGRFLARPCGRPVTASVSRPGPQPRYRKQPGRWSSTSPTLCMNA